MNKWAIGNIVILNLLLVPIANADLKEDTLALCDKIKSCVLEQVDQETLPPQVKEMMNGLFLEQCEQIVKTYERDLNDAGLEDKAHACLTSLQEQSCSALLSGQDSVKTPQCEDFEAAADAAGIELNQ